MNEIIKIVKILEHRIEKLEDGIVENIIDNNNLLVKSDDNFDILKNKSHLNNTELIDTLNELYKIGIRFEKVIDVNCYDNELVKYIKERGYTCDGTSLVNKIEDCSITDINLSNYGNDSYDMVVCFNLFEYLTDNNIQIYYKNLLRISNSYIIIKINMDETNEKIEHYMKLFNNVVSEQNIFVVQRFITKNLPMNLFILRKEIINININNE